MTLHILLYELFHDMKNILFRRLSIAINHVYLVTDRRNPGAIINFMSPHPFVWACYSFNRCFPKIIAINPRKETKGFHRKNNASNQTAFPLPISIIDTPSYPKALL